MNKKVPIVAPLILVGALLVVGMSVFRRPEEKAGRMPGAPSQEVPSAAIRTTVVPVNRAEEPFPLNDAFKLPFLGEVKCFSRPEEIEFEADGKVVKWTFRVFYSRSGMPIRAEFKKPGAKDFEKSVDEMQASYQKRGHALVGFPAKPAHASFKKVLESLYEEMPFDQATKINISWILWDDEPNQKVRESFIANVWGVPIGFDRVPDEEGFRKFRMLLSTDGEPQFIDNLL